MLVKSMHTFIKEQTANTFLHTECIVCTSIWKLYLLSGFAIYCKSDNCQVTHIATIYRIFVQIDHAPPPVFINHLINSVLNSNP